MVHSVHGWLYAHVLHVWTSNEGVAGTPVGRTTAEANANGVRAPSAVTTVACMPTPCAMCSWRCLGAPSSNVCCRQGAVYAGRKQHTVFPSPPAPVGSTGGPPAALSPHAPSLQVSKRHGNGMASGMARRTKQVLSAACHAAARVTQSIMCQGQSPTVSRSTKGGGCWNGPRIGMSAGIVGCTVPPDIGTCMHNSPATRASGSSSLLLPPTPSATPNARRLPSLLQQVKKASSPPNLACAGNGETHRVSSCIIHDAALLHATAVQSPGLTF